MSTITVDQYNDDGTTARSAGETLTINGGIFTQRTDTRWCSGAPASMTGTYNDILVSATLGGGFVIDGTKVRWLAYNSGTGNVPAIGTSITQAGVSSSYLLGVYDTITSAPTAVGAAMPADGFIKFREVSGTFASGALTGIGASSTGADVTGWIEVVMDQAAGTDISIPRLGKFESNGDWFYLDNTDGTTAQILQVPTNGGGANTYCPGVWIETDVGSGEYEFYPGLNGSTNGWSQIHLGSPGQNGANQDSRTKFVKSIGSGQMQIGENVTQSATYTTATQASTYTWSANLVTVTFTAHGFRAGEQVYLDFTSGGATTNDGVYTVYTVPTANTYTVQLSGSGSSGNVTSTAKTTITFASHGLAIGNLVYLNYTSGSGVGGIYMVEAVAANTITVNSPWLGSTGGNVTIEYTIGYIPTSGRKTRIPNIFIRQCTTAARASNAVPTTTIANRPEFITTSAGYVDAKYLYGDWYFNIAQSYYFNFEHSASFDSIVLSECSTTFNINDVGVGMYGALDAITLILTSNFAGGTINNSRFHRGNTPGTSDHAVSATSCNNLTITNSDAGIVQFVRSTGLPWNFSTCNTVSINNCRQYNGYMLFATSQNISISNLDHVDRYTGYTNATTPVYCVAASAGNINISINGITVGFGGTIPNCHPYYGFVSLTAIPGAKVRNIGTRSSMVSAGSIPLYAAGVLVNIAGNNNIVKIQRCYIVSGTLRSGFIGAISNSDNRITLESVFSFQYRPTTGVYTDVTMAPVALNSYYKGIGAALNTTTGQTSVYGTHWMDLFISDTAGRIVSIMNEPTSDTISYNSLSLSTSKGGFTSAGGLSLPVSGDYYITEIPYYILGHTSFQNTSATITATNSANHTFEYQIDTGSGWNGSWKTINGSNLSAESISASTGFKLKFKITCSSSSTTNLVNFVRIDTGSDSSSQADNLYALDANTLTLTGLKSGSEVRCYTGSPGASAVEIGGIESSGTSFVLTHSSGGVSGFINIINTGYQAYQINLTYEADDISIPVSQVIDRNYQE